MKDARAPTPKVTIASWAALGRLNALLGVQPNSSSPSKMLHMDFGRLKATSETDFTMCDKRGSATSTVLIENNRVKVTEWRFGKKGDNTGWHRHAHDYVVVPQFDGILEMDLGDGQRSYVDFHCGLPYFRQLGVEHDVINANDFECAFIEIELLEPHSG